MFFGRPAESSAPIGLIAGKGEFPLVFAQAASSLGKKVILFGLQGYTDKRIEGFVEKAHYVELGALGRLLEFLKQSGIRGVVLAGAVPKREIYNAGFPLDDTARGFIHGNANKGDDHLLRALTVFLKVKCGVSVLDSRRFLKDILASKGVMTRRVPTGAEWEDLKLGWRVAKAVGKMDVGQTVVVKDGVVLAVEALEGTDAAIRRGGELGHGGCVVVKAAKPNQDLKFDLPCVGLETLEALRSASSGVLGVEAGKTLMLFKDKLLAAADDRGVAVVGL